VLKDRSGAAVTESEAQRLLREFSLDKYRFSTEADFLAALKTFEQLLEDNQKEQLRAFRPEVQERYLNPSGPVTTYQRKGGVEGTPSGGGLTPDKKARLEELRKKLGK